MNFFRRDLSAAPAGLQALQERLRAGLFEGRARELLRQRVAGLRRAVALAGAAGGAEPGPKLCSPSGLGVPSITATSCGLADQMGHFFSNPEGIPDRFKHAKHSASSCLSKKAYGMPLPFVDFQVKEWCLPELARAKVEALLSASLGGPFGGLALHEASAHDAAYPSNSSAPTGAMRHIHGFFDTLESMMGGFEGIACGSADWALQVQFVFEAGLKLPIITLGGQVGVPFTIVPGCKGGQFVVNRLVGAQLIGKIGFADLALNPLDIEGEICVQPFAGKYPSLDGKREDWSLNMQLGGGIKVPFFAAMAKVLSVDILPEPAFVAEICFELGAGAEFQQVKSRRRSAASTAQGAVELDFTLEVLRCFNDKCS